MPFYKLEFISDKTLLQVPTSEEKRRRFSKSGANSDSNIHKRIQAQGKIENMGKLDQGTENPRNRSKFRYHLLCSIKMFWKYIPIPHDMEMYGG